MAAGDSFSDRYKAWTFGGLVVLVAGLGFFMVLPLLPAILWAVVLGVLLTPLNKRFRRRFGPSVSAGLTTLSGIAMIAVPLIVVGFLLAFQVDRAASDLSKNRPNGQSLSLESVAGMVDDVIAPVARQVGVEEFSALEWFQKNRAEITKGATGLATKLATSLGLGTFTLVVAFLTVFFILRDGRGLREPAVKLIPVPDEKAQEILDKTQATIEAVFLGIVLVAIIQAALAGVAYALLGVPSPVLWAALTFVVCLVPLLGPPVAYVPLSLLLFSQGKTTQGIILLVVGFAVLSQIDNLIKPWIIGSRTNLPAIAVFFSLMGGLALFGPVGVIMGPVVLVVALSLHEIIQIRLREDSSSVVQA